MLITFHMCEQNELPLLIFTRSLSIGSVSNAACRRVINWFRSFMSSMALPHQFYMPQVISKFSRSQYFVAQTVFGIDFSLKINGRYKIQKHPSKTTTKHNYGHWKSHVLAKSSRKCQFFIGDFLCLDDTIVPDGLQ